MKSVRALSAWSRDPNPVFIRELQSIFRAPAYQRFMVALTAALAIILVLVAASQTPRSNDLAMVGQLTFHAFFTILTLALSQLAPAYGATVIANERQTGTYESLIVSGIAPRRIIRGKFAACYSATVTVVVALAPVSAIIMLLGGVSPLALIIGFMWVLGAIAPLIAYGIAVSASLKSTWISVIATYFSATPLSWLFAGTVMAISLLLGGNEEPFGFATLFATRPFELKSWIAAFVIPSWLFGVPTVFYLVSAERALKPHRSDHSTPLKYVIAIAHLLNAAIVFAICALTTAKASNVALLFGGAFGLLLPVFAVLLAGEPPTPLPGASNSARGVLGSGAAPMLRFALLSSAFGAFVVPFAGIAGAILQAPHRSNEFLLAATTQAVGIATCACFFAAFSHWLHLVARRVAVARTFSTAAALAWFVVPLIAAIITAPRGGWERDELPTALTFAPYASTDYALNLVRDYDPPPAVFPTSLIPLIALTVLGTLAFTLHVEFVCARASRAKTVKSIEPESGSDRDG